MRNCLIASLLSLMATTAFAQAPCPARLFVSGYFSNVHVFDACSGAWLQDLDVPGRIRGAQAVTLGPDGRLYVVSEQTSEILRYRNDTLAFDGVYVTVPGIAPTSIAFGPDGHAFVSGYETHDVREFDATGTLVRIAVAPHAAGLAGPDIGMRFIGGALYVPGYDSNSVVRYDPATRVTSVAIAPRAGGLSKPRSILAAKDGQSLIVSSEGAGTLLRLAFATGEVSLLARVPRAQGFDYAPDGDLLAGNGADDSVLKLDPSSGTVRGTFVPARASGLRGVTYVATIPRAAPPSRVRVVDFYNATLDHWFISSLPADIAALDGGALKGWARTGSGFDAWDGPAPGTSPVCRFYLPPSAGDSHFYSASPTECADVRARFPAFVAEAPDVFHVALPDATSGACPGGTTPVYRLWNARADSNHRYTTDPAVKAQMVARGFVAEGYGPDAVIMCAAS